jgi:type I restriction enzyme S subunit
MASIPKGPYTFFRLSPAGASLRCFGVTRGDVGSVANAQVLFSEHYGDLKTLKTNSRYPLGTIGEMLAMVQDGLHGVRRYVPEGVALLGVGNITEDGIDLTEVNRITLEEHERLAASQVRRGDLLVTITGRLGTAAIYDLSAPANLSAHVALCRAKPGHELLYLKHYLASRFGAASLTTAQIGSTHPHINVRRLIELPIPLPEQSKQQELSVAMEHARAKYRTRVTEADALLTGIDRFLLGQVGLTEPEAHNRRVFAVSSHQVRQEGRLDPDYFHPERILALRNLGKRAGHFDRRLGDAVEFIREQVKVPTGNYLGLANVQSHTGELVESDEEVAGLCFLFKTGDVLFARLRPYLNKVYRAESDGCCSPEFHVLRVRDPRTLKPDYLAAVLRSSIILAQTRHMMTGNTHPRLTSEDIVDLVIPVPKPDVQEAIAVEVRTRRTESRHLHAEAVAEWQDARRRLEDQLVRPAQP